MARSLIEPMSGFEGYTYVPRIDPEKDFIKELIRPIAASDGERWVVVYFSGEERYYYADSQFNPVTLRCPHPVYARHALINLEVLTWYLKQQRKYN